MTRILIIEDDKMLRDEIAQYLGFSGYDVTVAHDGAEGLAILSGQAVDVILCDIRMPGMDGYEVLQALRGSGETAGLPFIFLTARVEQADIERGLALGASHYLAKPFSFAELLATIDVCLT